MLTALLLVGGMGSFGTLIVGLAVGAVILSRPKGRKH